MLIAAITNLMSKAGVVVEYRPLVARILVRSILGVSSYNKDRAHLTSCRTKHNRLTAQVEAVIWQWVRDSRWDWKINTCYWRAMACVFETRDISRAAHTFGVPAEDISYIIAQMTPEDIDCFVQQNRNWRTSPIDDKAIGTIMKMCKKHVSWCAYKLTFVSKYDQGRDQSDWVSYFNAEVLQVIYKYEDRKSLQHLVNTIKLSLKNKLGIMQGRYSSMKHGVLINSSAMEPMTKKSGPGVKKGQKPTRETNTLVTYVNRRASLMVQSADGGGETENPELLSRSTKIEGGIEAEVFIHYVAKQSANLARYLRLVTFENHEDTEFNVWLDSNNYSIDSIRDLASKAAQFCQIKRADLLRLKELATAEYRPTEKAEA